MTKIKVNMIPPLPPLLIKTHGKLFHIIFYIFCFRFCPTLYKYSIAGCRHTHQCRQTLVLHYYEKQPLTCNHGGVTQQRLLVFTQTLIVFVQLLDLLQALLGRRFVVDSGLCFLVGCCYFLQLLLCRFLLCHGADHRKSHREISVNEKSDETIGRFNFI